MKEEQVDPIPLIVNSQPALATNESKVPAQLEQEGLKMNDESFLQFSFRVLIFQPKKLQNERIFDFFFWSNLITRLSVARLFQHCGLVARQRGSFVELASHLALQLSN